MAINTSKTKFIVLRTRGKRVAADECLLVYNDNEIGTTLTWYFPSLEFTMKEKKNLSNF